ncbi:phosphotransferase-like protein [Nocardia asteroides]|uniref:phosphotransferase-like protein n=1 Tax=Nocardia asteroides TaxID=1824 RepID=UPI0034028F49
MLTSACRAAAAFAHGGDQLIVDEMLLTPDLLAEWLDALAGLRVQLVAVTCPQAVADKRELSRRAPKGLARGHFHLVHEHGHPYDLTVDTSTAPPAELARVVLEANRRAGG